MRKSGRRIVAATVALAAGVGLAVSWVGISSQGDVAATGYRCQGIPVPLDVVHGEGVLATTVFGVSAPVGPHLPEFDPERWVVLSDTSDRVSIVRPFPSGSGSLGSIEGQVQTHELIELFRTESTSDADEEWSLSMYSQCAFEVDLPDGLRNVGLELDGVPDPQSTTLSLRVFSPGCLSDEEVARMLRTVNVDEGVEAVNLTVGIEPLDEERNCAGVGGMWDPYSLELTEPLGSRTVRDASVSPVAEILVASDWNAPN